MDTNVPIKVLDIVFNCRQMIGQATIQKELHANFNVITIAYTQIIIAHSEDKLENQQVAPPTKSLFWRQT